MFVLQQKKQTVISTGTFLDPDRCLSRSVESYDIGKIQTCKMISFPFQIAEQVKFSNLLVYNWSYQSGWDIDVQSFKKHDIQIGNEIIS